MYLTYCIINDSPFKWFMFQICVIPDCLKEASQVTSLLMRYFTAISESRFELEFVESALKSHWLRIGKYDSKISEFVSLITITSSEFVTEFPIFGNLKAGQHFQNGKSSAFQFVICSTRVDPPWLKPTLRSFSNVARQIVVVNNEAAIFAAD